MENLTRSSMAVVLGGIIFCIMSSVCMGIETPKYEVVHSDSEFEIRLYSQSTWMSASIPCLSFAKATRIGYHRLFQYIEGANLNNSRIPMTIPVLTSIVSEPGSHHPSADSVRFYLPAKFQAGPPLPLPELNLKPYSSASRCVAAMKFPGFARDWNIGKEAEKLVDILSKSPWAKNSTSVKSGLVYTVAQYSSPFKFTGRKNEVWIDIDGTASKDCATTGGIASSY